MKLKNNILQPRLGFYSFLLLFLSACSMKFTFSGVNIDPRVENFNVETFYAEASDGPSNMGFTFSEALKDYVLRNTSLKLSTDGTKGDLEYRGAVTGYRVTPVAPGATDDQTAELQRLTITVKVDFINNYDDEKSFNQSFSFFSDFPASQNVQSVEDELIDEIYEQIVFDVFNKSLADW